ncbi:MAG: hypothetical protein GY781_05430 [Gammaproteobacteria bacterium]|nr:hypothetical protein [Gammaproteobacteria bacterium]
MAIMSSKYPNLMIHIIINILVVVLSTLSWFLLDTIPQANEIFSSASVIFLKVGILAAVLVVLSLTIKQLTKPQEEQKYDLNLADIINNAINQTNNSQEINKEKFRKTIIKLHGISKPGHHKIALSLAKLLEQLLLIIDDTKKESQQQQQENVTLGETTQELEDKHTELSKTPQLRSEFLSRMGDEITTPMNSLRSMLKLLNEMDFERDTRDLLQIASHSAHSLLENLSNILEFSKLDANLLQLQYDHFNIRETISSVLETQESIAIEKTLLLETTIAPDVPGAVLGNQQAISKVLDNLISNAIRFTKKGYIQLSVDYQNDGKQMFLRFTVSDTGIGIPESALKTLFDSLDKDTDLVNSSFAGRLRLIVSKQLCELMGGQIGVRSQQEKGSQFWFTVNITD